MDLYHYHHLMDIIRDVHNQHADDLCWMPADVNRIFVAAGLPPQDMRIGDPEAMLTNCRRYVGVLCAGGPWKSYAELEQENEQLRAGLIQTSSLGVSLASDVAVYTPQRASGWGTVRDDWIASQPRCQVCGTRDVLQVHHKQPYHLYPDLELSWDNLITLCLPHHLLFGHLMHWTRWNPQVVADCDKWRSKIEYASAKEIVNV